MSVAEVGRSGALRRLLSADAPDALLGRRGEGAERGEALGPPPLALPVGVKVEAPAAA